MGKGIVDSSVVNPQLILSALIGAVMWVWVCTHYGLPISVSHALIGGLIGPVWFTYGSGALITTGIFKIGLFIVLSPLIGAVLSFIMMSITMLIFKNSTLLKLKGFLK